MKKILLLILCCLVLCGCESKTEETFEDENNTVDYSKKILECSIDSYYENGNAYKNVTKSYFEESGKIKDADFIIMSYFDSTREAQAYYDALKGYGSKYQSLKITGTVVYSEEKLNISRLFGDRGTFEKEKQYYESKDYTCKVQDAE